MKVVIIGGVAGGASAAARLRRLDERAQIIIFERSGFVSYANCGLPYYIGGKIKSKSALTLQTPQSFMSRFNIDVRVRHEVMSIDRQNKKVTVKNIETGEIIKIGDFFHDLQHKGFTRCDLHPRFSDDGQSVYIDTIYTGKRQLCKIELNGILS